MKKNLNMKKVFRKILGAAVVLLLSVHIVGSGAFASLQCNGECCGSSKRHSPHTGIPDSVSSSHSCCSEVNQVPCCLENRYMHRTSDFIFSGGTISHQFNNGLVVILTDSLISNQSLSGVRPSNIFQGRVKYTPLYLQTHSLLC